ncbi:PQQ-binding-like beta-propeller repeat protein [Nonomuraea angiospora]|uniref:PQQ-binding-like beta-propeller repeat protein n=1 Tax=Nonomuraea angiospora TaxID=46172 RepID=UPI00342796E5
MISHRSWWGWFGAGLALAGVVSAAWAYAAWCSPPDWPPLPAASSHPPRFATAVLVLGIAPVLWLVVATVRAVLGARPAEDIRAAALACAVVWGGAATYHWIQVSDAFASGRLGAYEAAFGTGLAAAAAGLAGMVIAFRPVMKGASGVLGGSAAAVVMSVAALVSVAMLPVGAANIDATTAKKGGPPAAAPASVGRIAWQWKTPEGVFVTSVVTAGAGAVVQVTDGLVALDSTTGKERWHYRRVGDIAFDLQVSPDGSIVMVGFLRQTLLVDAYTGVVLAEHAKAWGGARYPELNSKGIVTARRLEGHHSQSPGLLTGWDPATSVPTWRYAPPKGCVGGYEPTPGMFASPQYMARDVLAVLIICAPWTEEKIREDKPRTFTFAVLGLDPATGTEVWRHKRKVLVEPNSVRVYRSTDARAVSVVWGEHEGVVLDQTSGKVLARQRVTGVFSAEGSLDVLSASGGESGRAYRWEPFGMGARKQMSFSPAGLGASIGGSEKHHVPLDDSLVVAATSWKENVGSVTVFVTPWGTADTVRIPMTFPAPWPMLSDQPPSAGLVRAPGAVIVVQPMSNVIVGLA